MDAKTDTNQEKTEARIDVNNEKFEVLQGTLVFQMKTVSTQEEIKAKIVIHQEKMKATIDSIWSELGRPSNIGWKTSCCLSTKGCRTSARNSPRRLMKHR
jgi:hypothetical protein